MVTTISSKTNFNIQNNIIYLKKIDIRYIYIYIFIYIYINLFYSLNIILKNRNIFVRVQI